MDWGAIVLRYVFMGALVVIPVVFLVVSIAIRTLPILGWAMGAVALMYLPPLLLLLRAPSVTLMSDHSIVFRNPRTVAPRDLVNPLTAAVAYFSLATFVGLMASGDQLTFHPERVVPVIREVFTVDSPLDLVGIMFFLLLLYVVIGGTVSFFVGQVRAIYFVIRDRRPTYLGKLPAYTKSLLTGECPDLAALRLHPDPARRVAVLEKIVCGLRYDPSNLGTSLRRQFERRLRQDTKLASSERGTKQITTVARGKSRAYLLANISGEA